MLVGFVDAFMTIDRFGQPRWEIDLVAVHSATRGRGMGKALVTAAAEAVPPDVRMARGLIRIGNRASEAAFAAAGFRVVSGPLILYVAPPLEVDYVPGRGVVVQVATLTYSGLWLESLPHRDDLITARGRAAALGVDQVGTLISEGLESVCEEAGYVRIGDYHWWSMER
jgi:hypothetical protein